MKKTVTGILYRNGPEQAPNSYYYWRIYFEESQIPKTNPKGADAIRRFDGIAPNNLKQISEEIDDHNLKKSRREPVSESELIEKITQIIK